MSASPFSFRSVMDQTCSAMIRMISKGNLEQPMEGILDCSNGDRACQEKKAWPREEKLNRRDDERRGDRRGQIYRRDDREGASE